MVIGEALIDIVEERDGTRSEHVGGSPANVAIGLARLGHDSMLLTHLGFDPRGERIASHLAAENVALADGSFGAGPTSTAEATIGADGAATYRFDIVWYIPQVSVRSVAAVHAGSLGLFLSPGADVVAQLLGQAADHGIVTLDPNVRPDLLPDHDAAVERFETALALADLVKLSDEDAAWLYPGLDESAVLRRLVEAGPSVAVMTKGADGALAMTRERQAAVPARPGPLVDTIGAGDSFMASLIASLLRDGVEHAVSHLDAVLRRAAAAASLAVAAAGAQPPHLTELDAAEAADATGATGGTGATGEAAG